MPHLNFELTNRRFFHEIGAGYSTIKLVFDAIADHRDEINIKGKGTLLKHGSVTITSGELNPKIGSISYHDAWEDTDTGKNHPHFFEIVMLLPTLSFESILNTNLESSTIYLRFSTKLFDGGITYGYAPDGSEKEWDVEKENPVNAESISVTVMPREKLDSEIDESAAIEATASAPSPQVILDPQLLHQVRSLWWVIVVIGGLVLAKLYL